MARVAGRGRHGGWPRMCPPLAREGRQRRGAICPVGKHEIPGHRDAETDRNRRAGRATHCVLGNAKLRKNTLMAT